MSGFAYGYTQSAKLAAPELSLEVLSPASNERRQEVICVVDTGACASCIPQVIVKSLDLKDYRRRQISWGDGRVTSQNLYAVDLAFGEVVLRDVWVLATEKEYGLIGRDILNKYRLLCDGPSRVWSVEPRWR